MGVTLVDSNILFDIITHDEKWYDWSAKAILNASSRGGVAINPIVYSEVSVEFEDAEMLEDFLTFADFQRLDLPWEAAFLAGRCFKDYKKRGGIRRSPLPDFYIGAHAFVLGLTLLTRDASRYRTYLPELDLLAPR